MFSRAASTLFLLLVSLFFVACNDSNNDFIAAPPSQVPQVTTIRLTQPLLRAVPQEVTQQRFSGFDSQGAILYGPFTRDKAATIELENVSTAVTRLQIEYLRGETVIGLGSVEVDLVFGEVFEVVNPPFQDVVSALSALQVTPGGATIANGSAQQFTVIGTFADNTQADLTSSATWTSSNTATATIAPGGLASAVGPGETTITANIGAVSNSTTLTVSEATISSIDITPGSPSIANGTQQQFTATANLSDGGTQDVTTSANWSSSATAVATIGTNTGLADAQSSGQTTISATAGSVTGSTTLNVTNASVTSLVISPGNQTIAEGTTQQFTVTANFSSGPSQDVTSSATWTSSVPATASITSPGGLATAEAAGGTTSIEASFGGQTASTNLTVSDAEIASIEVTPANPVIADGTDQQFTATATLTNGDTQNVTMSAAWTSSATATATVDSGTGLATAVDPGQTVITAAEGGVSGSTTLTVSAADVESIEVTPANPTVANGATQQFTAIATLSDASTQDVTSSANWTSGTTGVVTISNPGGLATVQAGTGTSLISAEFGGQTGSTTLTATDATLESITISPDPAVLALGETVDFTATGAFSDGSNSDITDMVTWGSDDTNVATVVASGANAGRASTAGTGNTVITADSGSVTGTAVIVVTDAALESIAVEPPAALSAPGSTRQYRAIGTYSDGSTHDLTSQVTWSSDNTDVVIANTNLGLNKVGQAVVADSATAGSQATITADFQGTVAQSNLDVGFYLYSANDGRDVSRYSFDTQTGQFTFQSSFVASESQNKLLSGPSGRYLYAVSSFGNAIVRYLINPADGSLSREGSLAVPDFPTAIEFHPNGQLAFVGGGLTNSFLRSYIVDPLDGSLTDTGFEVTDGRPRELTISPDGRFLYAADFVNGMRAYEIDQETGELTLLSSFTNTGQVSEEGVSVHPSGSFLYKPGINNGTLSIFTVDRETGVVTAATPPTLAIPNLTEIVVGPGGRYAYIFRRASPSGEVYTIDQQTGALTATGVTIPGLSTGGYDLTFDPSGRYLIGTVLAPGDTEIVSYTQNPIDGSLSLNTILSLSGIAEWIGITP